MRVGRIMTAMMLSAAFGCAAEPSTIETAQTCATPATKEVTFYGDLLPILTSNTKSRGFRCTTCHAHYGTASGLSSVAEIDAIVQSLTAGRMPRGGDPVPAKDIELFRTWQAQGFKVGTPTTPSSKKFRCSA